jgi:hypothetical protein
MADTRCEKHNKPEHEARAACVPCLQDRVRRLRSVINEHKDSCMFGAPEVHYLYHERLWSVLEEED